MHKRKTCDRCGEGRQEEEVAEAPVLGGYGHLGSNSPWRNVRNLHTDTSVFIASVFAIVPRQPKDSKCERRFNQSATKIDGVSEARRRRLNLAEALGSRTRAKRRREVYISLSFPEDRCHGVDLCQNCGSSIKLQFAIDYCYLKLLM